MDSFQAIKRFLTPILKSGILGTPFSPRAQQKPKTINAIQCQDNKTIYLTPAGLVTLG